MALCLLLFSSLGLAQEPVASDAPSISLLTLGPGHEIFERFSHNAIWVHNPAQPGEYRDVAFNYGLFSFGQSFVTDFLPAFLRGDMKYQMAPMDGPASVDMYRKDDRDIFLQQLRLSPRQAQRLTSFLWNNYRPENRYYIYNYFVDNCSTRVRDALDATLDGQIKLQSAGIPTGQTYRMHTLRTLCSNIPAYIGVDFALGQLADKPLSRWDEMFLPLKLQAYLRDITIPGPGGTSLPLVVSEQRLSTSSRQGIPETAPHWEPGFLIAGGIMAGGLLFLDRFRHRRVARWLLWIGIVLWTLLGAIATAFLILLECCTHHWAAYQNENILQMPPVVVLTFLLLLTPIGQRHARLCRWKAIALFAFTVLTATCSIIGLMLKLAPAMYQENWNIILWVLPVHLAVAMIFYRRYRKLPQPGLQLENV